MASSTIDVLLQATTAPRGAEAAPRAGDGAAPFKPALEQALAERPPATAPTNAASEDYEPTTQVADPDAKSRDASHDDGDQPAEVDVATPAAGIEEEAATEEESDDDAVDISEAAGAAAVAAATNTNVNQTTADRGAAEVEEIRLAAATIKTSPIAQPANTAATGADQNSATAAKPTLEAQSVNELVADQDGVKKAATGGKPSTKREGGKPTNDGALPLTDGAKSDAIAPQAVDAAANAVNDPPQEEKVGDLDLAAREATPQTSDGRRDAKQAEVVAVPAATIDAVAAAADAAAVPTNEQSPGEGAVKPTSDVAAAAAASRGAAALERLTAPRGVRPGGSTSETESTPQVDPARFVSRVEGAMRTAHQRDGRVQVRLSPPELGALRIELQMHAGGLTAHIEAETASARKLLLDNLPALRERLAQQDIRVEKFEVDVRRDGGQPSGGGPQDRQADQPTRQSHDERSRPMPRPAAAPARSAAPAATTISDAGLDVRI